MDRDLPLLPTGLFLISLIACIALYMQRVDTFEVPPVGQIFELSGDVNFLFKNEILSLDQEKTVLNLSSYGIDKHVGQLGIARDGTVYANTEGQSTSLLKKWRSYLRKKEGVAKDNNKSLLKCSNAQNCQPWGDGSLQFDRAWSMFEIDDDHFIINDTARHQIHLLDKSGKVLNTLDNFLFPNHTFDHQDSSWLVNTNTNSFIELDIQNGVISRSGKSINLKQFEGIPKGYRFPSIAYSDGKGKIISLVHPNGMNQGKVFWLNDGEAIQEFEHLKDITAIFLNQDTLYAADYETHTIWSKNLASGDQAMVVNSNYREALDRAEVNADAAWERYIFEAIICLGAGFIALYFAIAESTPVKNIRVNIKTEEREIFQANGTIHWVQLSDKQARNIDILKKSPTISALIAFPSIALAISSKVFNWESIHDYLPILYMLAWLFLTALIVIVLMKRFFGKDLEKLTQRLGWDGEFIHLRNIQNKTKALPENVYFSEYSLYADGVSIPIQFASNRFFEKNSFEKLISPALCLDNRLSTRELIKHKLKESSSDMVASSFLMVLIISFFIALQIISRI